MADDPCPVIECTPDGPLLVKGLPALRNSRGEALPVKSILALCRCGGSAKKPFCDGTHAKTGWSSRREIDKPLDRYRDYRGKDATIQDNRVICSHAARCTDELGSVFSEETKPWINADGASAEQIAALTRRCPSGALRALVKGRPVPEPPAPPAVTVAKNGPYEVRGGVELQSETGLQPPVPQRYTLCRCGVSKNKPFCDGSHWDAEFQDPAN